MSLLHRGSRALAVLVVAAGVTAAASSGSVAHAARSAPAAPQKTAAASTTQQSAADSSSSNDIYVDNLDQDNCSDNGSGTEAQPFCTINAAAAVVQPGQTVIVEPGYYDPSTISVSGTSSQPITFQGATTSAAIVEHTTAHWTDPSTEPAFTISGAHNVVITGFNSASSEGAYEIDGQSSNITIKDGEASSSTTVPAVQVDSASDVTVKNETVETGGIQVNSGASQTTIARSTFIPVNSTLQGINVTGADGTNVVGNTMVSTCPTAVTVSGSANDTTIENNVIGMNTGNNICTSTGTAAVSVSADSTSSSTSDYNLFDSNTEAEPYEWGDTDYSDLTLFTATTGQGMHDISTSAQFNEQNGFYPGFGSSFYYPSVSDATIDSANANSAGAVTTDVLAQPDEDNPNVANSGTGSISYMDRGSWEMTSGTSFPTSYIPAASGPLTISAKMQTQTGWTADGQYPFAEVVDFGDKYQTVIGDGETASHTYSATGTYTVKSAIAGPGSNYNSATQQMTTQQIVVGAGYTSVAPKRVMDTRNGTGVAKGAVAGNGTVTLPVSKMPGVPSGATAVVLNLTETGATGSGYITAYPGKGTAPTTSNINYTKGTTIPNQVTVPVANGEVSFKNGSGGTVQLVADLAGYYGAGGDGYAPQTPTRVLDTRNGTGAAKAAIPADGKIQLDLSKQVPAGTSAVTLNVTATQPGGSGWLAVYPDSSTTPTTSSLNFTAGQTVANLVTVPLNNGIADLYNGSGKTVQVVADLQGTYGGASATDTYVPYGPTRIIDTRSSGSKAVAADGTLAVEMRSDTASTVPVAAVDNITVTQPVGSGYLTAYPDGTTRPVASNLNFNAGNTVQNLSTTQTGASSLKIDFYNGSGGTVQVIVDEDGYFIANQ